MDILCVYVIIMGADTIPKSIFSNQPKGNRLRGRSRNRWRNCAQADLRKFKIFDWKNVRQKYWKRFIEDVLIGL